MREDREIVSVAVYPGIGIARVGNSRDEFFIGPEVPNPVAPPSGGYRDATGALKRQAARFRIYGFDAKGRVVREITADDGKIEWTVEVANKKAAWYDFVTAMDIPQATPVPRRNSNYTGRERRRLEITPKPRSIHGRNKTSKRFRGKFLDREVSLGELRTDSAGRLLFLGGHGISSAVDPNDKPYTFANNDGWHDDVSDGPVSATVHLEGRVLEAKPAWVITGPPNYAPDLISEVTIYDILQSAYIGNWLDQKKQPSFTEDIYPVLERFCTTQWVNKGFFEQFGFGGPNEFTRADLLERLAQSGDEFQELRRQVFMMFRYPTHANSLKYWTAPDNTDLSGGTSVNDWPWYYGDAVVLSSPSDNAYLSVPQLMYQYLYQWSEGDFLADWEGPPTPPSSLDDVPCAEQPATLDRAALDFCLGLAFHPGCEMTWLVRNYTLYSEPFRIRRRGPDNPEPDYGDVLHPDQVYIQGSGPAPGGPLFFSAPGDITRWMAVPWQTDTSSCRSGYVPEYDPYLPTFWPQRVPNQVLTEGSYEEMMSGDTSREEKIAAFNERAIWYRFLGRETDYLGQIDTMVHRFGDLGIVEKRPGPDVDYLPRELYVETGVQFERKVPKEQGQAMLYQDKVRRSEP